MEFLECNALNGNGNLKEMLKELETFVVVVCYSAWDVACVCAK